jgi:ATP-dependent RNA helicase DDX5/DBP2
VAKTGSGKTLGYLLPTIHLISKLKAGGPMVLVIAPTRELAQQINEECVKFCNKTLGLMSSCVYGGVPKGPQTAELRKSPQVLVATPGRLVDMMECKATTLAHIRHVVLDEADRMLDMGFEPQIKKILEAMPKERQLVCFTATWPKSVKRMAANYLRKDALHLIIGSTEELVANTAITQEFYKLDDSEKDEKLFKIIDELPEGSRMVRPNLYFVLTS